MPQPARNPATPRPGAAFAAVCAAASLLVAAAVIIMAILVAALRSPIADSASDQTLAALGYTGIALGLVLIIIGLLAAIAAAARGKRAGRRFLTAAGILAFLANGFALLVLFCVTIFLRSTITHFIDRSLTDAQYHAAGVPSPESRWSPDDYDQATAALKKIAADHPENLPRWKSRHSAATFDRIASLDNITSADTIEARIGVTSDLAKSVDALRDVYLAASAPAYPYRDEFIELSNLLLKISVPLKSNMQAFVDAIQDDTLRRAQAADRLHTVFTSLAYFADQWIDHMCDGTLDTDQITRMARYGRDGLPALVKTAPPEMARRWIANLTHLAAAATDLDEKAAISSLISSLRDAL